MPSTIVEFAPQHVEGVVTVIVPIQQSEFGIAISLDDQPDLQDVGGVYRRGAGNFWVALADGRVVGTIGLLDIGDGQGALRKMFVERGYRGAERGVAQGLLDALVAWCGTRGIRDLYLGTTEHFRAAHRFYAKHGFDEIDATALPPSFPRMRVDTKFYQRRLQEP